MNESWEEAGGRLRLLRSANNLNDIIVEVPPVSGTLLAFKRSNNSWHGHEPFTANPCHSVQLAHVAGQPANRHVAAPHLRIVQARIAKNLAEPLIESAAGDAARVAFHGGCSRAA